MLLKAEIKMNVRRLQISVHIVFWLFIGDLGVTLPHTLPAALTGYLAFCALMGISVSFHFFAQLQAALTERAFIDSLYWYTARHWQADKRKYLGVNCPSKIQVNKQETYRAKRAEAHVSSFLWRSAFLLLELITSAKQPRRVKWCKEFP